MMTGGVGSARLILVVDNVVKEHAVTESAERRDMTAQILEKETAKGPFLKRSYPTVDKAVAKWPVAQPVHPTLVH
jgi:hypothetical protein